MPLGNDFGLEAAKAAETNVFFVVNLAELLVELIGLILYHETVKNNICT